jgi:DNA-binding winged helix-turn-helix (wHTH) protein
VKVGDKIREVSTYSFGQFDLDLGRGELRTNGEEIPLEPRVFALLSYLVENAGRVIDRSELLDKIWPETHVSDASLTQAIASLREALEDDPRESLYVTTLPRRGYKFVAKVIVGRTPRAACHIFYGVREIVLATGENVIGRARDAAVCIRSDAVSRRHARIMVSATGATIEDLGSRNGTWVSDRRIEGLCDLRDGDQIVIGSVVLFFRTAESMSSSPTAPLAKT